MPAIVAAATFVVATLAPACNDPKAPPAATGIPPAITNQCPNILVLTPDSKTHIGAVQIADSILIAQTFDSTALQQRRLEVFNIKSIRAYGFFPWPDPDGSFNFGVAPARNSLIYYNGENYLRRIDLHDKHEDTLLLPKNISPMIDMVVAQEKVYSLGNSDGFDVVDLKSPTHQFNRHSQPENYTDANSISIPLDPALNLVAAATTDGNNYTVYAIDSNMTLRWQRTIPVKIPSLSIRAIHTSTGFLLKYDNKLELLAPKDGALLWQQECKYPVRNMQAITPDDVLLFLAEHASVDAAGGAPLGNRSIEKWSIPGKKLLWKIDSVGSGGDYAFIKSNVLFDIHDPGHWMMIDLATGKQSLFPFDPGAKSFSILHNKTNGENYLLYADSLYW